MVFYLLLMSAPASDQSRSTRLYSLSNLSQFKFGNSIEFLDLFSGYNSFADR